MDYLSMLKNMLNQANAGRARMIKECFDRWEESKHLPRKKKKRERKDILLMYSLAKSDPIDDLLNYFQHEVGD